MLEVDDREPCIGEPQGPRHMNAQIIRAAMGERGGHASQGALVGAAAPQQHPGYAAHRDARDPDSEHTTTPGTSLRI
jgi:hypothetical protein